MPVLDFPSGKVKAGIYDPLSDIFCFKNIRYGAPPVGELRFAKPQKPERNGTLSDGGYGPSCIQSKAPASKKRQLSGPEQGPTDEDCLFLDLYVSGKQLRDGAPKVPVMNWIFGGGFIFGSKDQADGLPLVRAAQGHLVFVASNYRLGAFGFAAGATMERDAQPNAGLYDQQAVLQWIQDNIEIVNGDKGNVTIMGESAGAGSIMHHITAFGGNHDPQFHRAILQSPAFQNFYDRRGALEDNFQKFAQNAGCGFRGGDAIPCLRNASASALISGNDAVTSTAPPSTYGFGPSADGQFVRQVPALELVSGNYFKNIDALILSHVADEAGAFIPASLNSNDKFDAFLPLFLTGSNSKVMNAVMNEYPRTDIRDPKWTNIQDREKYFIRDSTFTCNIRYMADAFSKSTPTWNVQYGRGPGLHGYDILANFYNTGSPLLNFLTAFYGQQAQGPDFPSFAASYQSYLMSFATTGDPNRLRRQQDPIPTIDWPKVEDIEGRNYFGNVLNASDAGFQVIDDDKAPVDACGFWVNALAALTTLGGYSPQGAVVPNNILGNGTDENPPSPSATGEPPKGAAASMKAGGGLSLLLCVYGFFMIFYLF
ncbi:alpha/beta-hydrolase [Aulographum hederae CBS 113979]|uniref:Alpha/beta-hydrolase n=1 Tax=Aulographum hederae CBS 113979 TaxID=1176131 RepID=A0A6G1HBU2_9PEZI|nr:alpha/beta-hydrolase [Aulographum hederae CBS 113979]